MVITGWPASVVSVQPWCAWQLGTGILRVCCCQGWNSYAWINPFKTCAAHGSLGVCPVESSGGVGCVFVCAAKVNACCEQSLSAFICLRTVGLIFKATARVMLGNLRLWVLQNKVWRAC